MSTQIQFPFASLDFAGERAVRLQEIALKLNCSVEHLYNFVQDGELPAIDLARHKGSRPTIRVALEDYRLFVVARLTCPVRRREFIAHLPAETLREIKAEIEAALQQAA